MKIYDLAGAVKTLTLVQRINYTLYIINYTLIIHYQLYIVKES